MCYCSTIYKRGEGFISAGREGGGLLLLAGTHVNVFPVMFVADATCTCMLIAAPDSMTLHGLLLPTTFCI